ncbi:condensation domain-containing protein [Streptomyces sp. NPDC005727]|uniref:condensation domain-containing protein n=1 Tax=Streptomyces sp. NPDC005727 TaxID=3157053 RepID=UPI0034021FBE
MSDALATRLAALSPEQRARLRATLARRTEATHELTPGQLRLWRAHHAVDGRPVDVVCQAVRLSGARPDLDALTERVRGFAAAHEALRTTFEAGPDGGEVRRVVHAELPPALTRAGRTDEAGAHALARQLAREPFDLAAGPLLRVALAEGATDDEAWLLVVAHNLVFDAWSFELLLDELDREPETAVAAAPGFGDFVRDQREWRQGPEGRAAAAYWAAEAADAPAPLPTDRPRGKGTARTGRRVDFTLPAPVANAIAASARRAGATAYAGWLAVAWRTLAEYASTEDVLLGTFTTGRNRPGTEEVVGYLLNVLPVRLREPGAGTHADRVRAVRDVTRAGLRHASYPGELIGGRRVPGTHPLLDAVFVFDNLGAEQRLLHRALVTTADLDKGTARYDLTIAVYPGPSGATGWLEYDTGLYDEATARRLTDRFQALARAAAAEGEA